ncbi:hypothetical protein [Pedobacter sandarakinus]|uniref:hypothetical protein n=1 Tax=Pedobacter sandarakinus TaxID=353156 RepID=UPI0022464687|nr:hypothetical protein [Pedobacter sandarakinus]MCX2573927.1 hypothetical protein [Pedobacter sandarakinus]
MRNLQDFNVIELTNSEYKDINGGNLLFKAAGFIHRSIQALVDWVYDPNNDQ